MNDNKIRINSINTEYQSINASIDDIIDLMLAPPDRNSPKNILNALNDDCLRLIFEKLHLSTLCSVSNVCVRFNTIASEIFQLKYKNKMIKFGDLGMTNPIKLTQVENFLETFGSSIDDLFIYPADFDFNEDLFNDITKMISKYCIGIKLLAMHGFSVNNEIIIDLREMFSRLKYLNTKFDHNRQFNDLIGACSQIEQLSITHINVNESISTEIMLPKLRSLSLVDYHCNYLESFLKFNQQLEEIYIYSDKQQIYFNSLVNISQILIHCISI